MSKIGRKDSNLNEKMFALITPYLLANELVGCMEGKLRFWFGEGKLVKRADSQGECALIRDHGRWHSVPFVPLQAGWEAGVTEPRNATKCWSVSN